MKRNMGKEDKLTRLDFNSAFPDTPGVIRDAIRAAELDIHRREAQMLRCRRWIYAIAAALVLTVGLSAAIFRLGGARDSVAAPPVLAGNPEAASVQVYTSKPDPYYHLKTDCTEAAEGGVALPLVTAREFDKLPCPVCGEGVK